MSRKNSNKVKKYVRRRNAIRNIGTIISSLIFMAVTGLTGGILCLSIFYTHVLTSDRDMKTLVSYTNTSWNDKATLDVQVIAAIDANPSFGQVLFLDDDFNILHDVDYISTYITESASDTKAAYDATDYDEYGNYELYLGDDIVYRDFDKKNLESNASREFKKNGIYRGLTFVPASTFEKGKLRLLSPRSFPYSKDTIDWAQEDNIPVADWIVYKTDIAGVNVCCRYVSIWNNLDFTLFNIGMVIVGIAIILFILSGFFYIASISRRRRYGNKIIYTDPVTGGFNRDYFINYALRGIRKKRQYAVIQFRLEKYSNYCTAFGLKKGEKLLEKIYWAAKNNLARKEKISHLEKADFAMLLMYEDREELRLRLIAMAESFYGKGQHLVFSAGIYPVQSRKEDVTEILTATGLALAKTETQNANIVWFNDEMKQEQIWERTVEDDMEKALKNHEFKVYLQPKYSTKKEKLAAAEALVRWIHPQQGFIPPGKFIPIFETNGFILQLDDYMLREISKLQADWLKEGKKLVPISVNVSRAHFTMDDLAEHICSIVDEYKVPHEFIELELTESAFFDDKATLLSTVKKLKSYGFKISMDDFGAGYSSLNSLKELPLDIIKLDAEFFRGIDDVQRANAIVGDTIALAKKLGMSIVAEGIETREQVDFLAGQDCDLIQGFYFAKPLPVDEFIERAYGKNKK